LSGKISAPLAKRLELAKEGKLKVSKERPTQQTLEAMGATAEQTRMIMGISRQIDALNRTTGGPQQVASWGLGCNDSCGMREEFVSRISSEQLRTGRTRLTGTR